MAPIVDRPYPRLVVRSLLPALALVVAGAVVLSACDAEFLPEAARVNGAIVSQSTLNSALDSVASDAGYRCLLESAAGSAHAVTGVSNGTYNTSFAAGALSLLIEAKAADVAVAREHLVVAPLARQVARAELATSFTPSSGSSCTEPGAEVLSTLGGGFAGALVSLQVDEDVLAAHAVGYTITTSGVPRLRPAPREPRPARLHRGDRGRFTRQGRATRDRDYPRRELRDCGGEELARRLGVARAAALGCITPSALTSPLGGIVSSLPVGLLSPPVKFAGEWILFEVTARRAPTLSEAASALRPRGDERRFEGTRELRRQGACRGRSARRHLGEGRQLL